METAQTHPLVEVAFCEPVWASGSSAWHLRLLEPGEEKKFGGGLTKPSLCGREVAWDLDTVVTPTIAAENERTCRDCLQAYGLLVRTAAARLR